MSNVSLCERLQAYSAKLQHDRLQNNCEQNTYEPTVRVTFPPFVLTNSSRSISAVSGIKGAFHLLELAGRTGPSVNGKREF